MLLAPPRTALRAAGPHLIRVKVTEIGQHRRILRSTTASQDFAELALAVRQRPGAHVSLPQTYVAPDNLRRLCFAVAAADDATAAAYVEGTLPLPEGEPPAAATVRLEVSTTEPEEPEHGRFFLMLKKR